MKRYKNLWDKFVSMENLELAAKKAVRSKKNKPETKLFLKHKQEFLTKLQQMLVDGKFNTSNYKIRRIFEPKERLIYILPLYPDHIVHHALINILGPIWQSTFIHDSYACIPGKGLHAASQRTMTFVKRNKYCLQCDIRKFYPSINHEIIMNIISKKIYDRRILNVLHNVVWSVGGETNIPIGNLTSQWLGNVYLNELDHFIKQQLRWKDYIRYCDDFCLYGNDKTTLKNAAEQIEKFLNKDLSLFFSKCEIRRTQDGITFIGYRHFKKFIMLKKATVRKIKRRLLNIIKHRDCSVLSCGQLTAANGWCKWACSYHFRKYIQKQAKRVSKCVYLLVRKNLPL